LLIGINLDSAQPSVAADAGSKVGNWPGQSDIKASGNDSKTYSSSSGTPGFRREQPVLDYTNGEPPSRSSSLRVNPLLSGSTTPSPLRSPHSRGSSSPSQELPSSGSDGIKVGHLFNSVTMSCILQGLVSSPSNESRRSSGESSRKSSNASFGTPLSSTPSSLDRILRFPGPDAMYERAPEITLETLKAQGHGQPKIMKGAASNSFVANRVRSNKPVPEKS
jgi:hypothetical protein